MRFKLPGDFIKSKTRKQYINTLLFHGSTFLLKKPNPPWNNPVSARIEITSRCNLACRTCLRPAIKKYGDMKLSNYRKIIKILQKAGLVHVYLFGFGEPLLHRNLIEMISFAKSSNLYTEIFTNGTLLDRKMSIALLSSGLNALNVSINGATKGTYEKIHKLANYDEVIHNIENLVELNKQSNNNLLIAMRFILMKENFYEAPKFVELAHKIGINHIFFGNLQYFWNHDMASAEQSLHLTIKKKEIEQLIVKVKKKAIKFNIRLSFPELSFHSRIRCLQPQYIICINWQGFVTPCCPIHDIYLGNIFEQTLNSIWKGKKFNSWRTQTRNLSPPKQCISCLSRQ